MCKSLLVMHGWKALLVDSDGWFGVGRLVVSSNYQGKSEHISTTNECPIGKSKRKLPSDSIFRNLFKRNVLVPPGSS